MTLEGLRGLYAVLATCGANVLEVTILRKHPSLIKRGRLAEAASPAWQCTLYVSDKPTGEPSSVASGPTMPVESTCEDSYTLAGRPEIVPRLPHTVRRRFERRSLSETSEPGSEAFRRSQWACLLDNGDALESLESKARSMGWILDRDLGVDDQPVDAASNTLRDRPQSLAGRNPDSTVAVTTGGELSSPVTGDGLGGAAKGSNSYRFFRRMGDHIVSGPTGNNVRDLRMLVTGNG